MHWEAEGPFREEFDNRIVLLAAGLSSFRSWTTYPSCRIMSVDETRVRPMPFDGDEWACPHADRVPPDLKCECATARPSHRGVERGPNRQLRGLI